MAYSALLKDSRIVSVDFCEAGLLMAVETTTLENETATRVEFVALSALNARNRRMLMKRLVTSRGIGTHKKSHFFPSALPCQNQRM